MLMKHVPRVASGLARRGQRHSSSAPPKVVRIGGASGFWGDTAMAAPQLLKAPIDYLVFDYLAETTMAIMAKMRARKPEAGYATDFVAITMPAIAKQVKASGVKVIANAGGINPVAAKAALEETLAVQGVDLKVGVVLGDDLLDRVDEFRQQGMTEMFSGGSFPDKVQSSNAYLGARPIATLLDQGCDVVLTGRIVDSAVTLGACMHEFGWRDDQYDALAGATLAGHIIECGAQGSGGLFTDWEQVAGGWSNIGYPIAEVEADGSFSVVKPEGTGGLIAAPAVAEQLLYEIGDPGAYHVPDVACDFTQVRIEQESPDRVRVSEVRGQPPTSLYKVTTTYADGWRNDAVLTIVGEDADRKAQATGEALLRRMSHMLKAVGAPDFTDTRLEIIGAESQYGPNRVVGACREVVLKMSAKHSSKDALQLFGREFASAATSMSPGTMPLVLGRPTPTPVVRVFSSLLAKDEVPVRLMRPGTTGDGETVAVTTTGGFERSASASVVAVPAKPYTGPTVRVPLIRLCWARSGDKGDTANVGVIARHKEWLPYLRSVLTEEKVASWYGHVLEGDVTRYDLPGIYAMNFVLTRALDGGGTSTLRSDSLAKAFAQQLLAMEIDAPAAWFGSEQH